MTYRPRHTAQGEAGTISGRRRGNDTRHFGATGTYRPAREAERLVVWLETETGRSVNEGGVMEAAEVISAARKEIAQEEYRKRVDAEKIRQRAKRSLWEKVFPLTVTFKRR